MYCYSSTYNCITDCAGCPSVEYHDCGHHQDVTVECSMLKTVLFPIISLISLAISTTLSKPSTITSTCDGIRLSGTCVYMGQFFGHVYNSIMCVVHVCSSTVPATCTGNAKMKHVCFCCKCVFFSNANEGVVFSHLTTQFKRKSPLVPCSVY